MSNGKWTGRAAAGLAAIAVWLMAASGPAAAQKPVRTVSIALSGGELTVFAPYLAALGNGAFERHGIKVDEQSFGSGTASFAAFAGGSVQFCVCGASQVLAAAGSGRDYVAFFNLGLGGAVVFVGAKKYEHDRGTRLAAYDGGTWAYSAEGSVSQVYMARAAQGVGLDWARQNHLAVGTVDAFIPTLRLGRADLVTMDGKSAAQAIQLGVGYTVFNTMDPAQTQPIWGEPLGLPMITSRAMVEKDPQLVQDVSDALREGLVAVRAHADDPAAVLALMPAQFQANNKSDFAAQWMLFRDSFLIDGSFTAQQLKDTFAFVVATGALKQPQAASVDPAHYFVNTFADKSIQAVSAGAGGPARP